MLQSDRAGSYAAHRFAGRPGKLSQGKSRLHTSHGRITLLTTEMQQQSSAVPGTPRVVVLTRASGRGSLGPMAGLRVEPTEAKVLAHVLLPIVPAPPQFAASPTSAVGSHSTFGGPDGVPPGARRGYKARVCGGGAWRDNSDRPGLGP